MALACEMATSKKQRLSVYLEPAILAKLQAHSDRRAKSKSLVAEAAIASYLSPDAPERLEAALSRRLDKISRQNERSQRDLGIAIEMSALFIRFWLNVSPSLPESGRGVAEARGLERYQSFMDALGRRLARGGGVAEEISRDLPAQHPAD